MNHHDQHPPRRLCRDPENAVLLGVCAGIAEYFDWSRWLVRLATLALAWIFPLQIVGIYLLAALVMPRRRLRYCGEGDERQFWQNHGHRS